MANTQTSINPLLFLVIMTSFRLLDFASGDQITGKALILTTCNKTDFPQECISALESNPESFRANNITTLSRIALKVTASEVINTTTYVEYWVNHAPDNATRSDTLACYYRYNRSIQTIDEGLQAFDDLVYDQAYQSVDSVNGAVGECINIGVKVLNEVNTKMFRITRDVMIILHQLF